MKERKVDRGDAEDRLLTEGALRTLKKRERRRVRQRTKRAIEAEVREARAFSKESAAFFGATWEQEALEALEGPCGCEMCAAAAVAELRDILELLGAFR